MQSYKLFSRRDDVERVDFRPDLTEFSPSAQLGRLRVYLEQTTVNEDDIEDAPEAIRYYREFLYRKIFGGTTHEEFLDTEENDPQAIDWLIAVSTISDEVYKSAQKKERS